MERLATRLTRDAHSVWLLELPVTPDQEVFRQVTDLEIPAILKILARTEVRRLIIDLAAREFDPGGLQFLGRLHQHLAAQNVPITLRNPGAHLIELLRLRQFDPVFKAEFDDSDVTVGLSNTTQ